MRAVWVDAGNNVDPVKLKAHGISRAYFDAREPVERTEFARNLGFAVGLYRTPTWDGLTAPALAHQLSTDVHDHDGDTRQLAVHANIEVHDPSYVLSFLTAWRSIRPYRDTGWVLEGMQGGWFGPQLVNAINADPNLQVVAEAFTGNMGAMDADVVRSNVVSYGIQRQRALVGYDGAALKSDWDGTAFTMGRLP